jgi:predicted secreted protein
MQVLTPLEGEILGSLVLIGFGIYMEKHYISWWNVLGNVLCLILGLATLNLEVFEIVILTVYSAIGIACTIKRLKKLYFLFGYKTYNSLMLVLGIFAISGAYNWLDDIFAQMTTKKIPEIGLFLIVWFIVALIVNIIGLIYGRKKKDE